jgi:hypothetical protein
MGLFVVILREPFHDKILNLMDHWIRRLQRLTHTSFFVPAVLLFFCVCGYGLLIPWMGYYGDDISMAWLAYKSHYFDYFFPGNRPIWGMYYQTLCNVLGPAPWHWQVYGLVWRWLSAFIFWRLCITLWPREKENTIVAALLFALYPAFWLSSEAMTFNLHYTQLTIFLASLLATVYSWLHPQKRIFWTALAFLGAFLNLVISEYYFFLELLRPILIWWVLAGQESNKRATIRRVFLKMLPFFGLFGAILLLRALNIGGINSGRSITFFQNFQNNPLMALLDLGARIGTDLWNVSVGGFSYAFTFPGLEDRSLPVLIAILLFLVTSISLTFLWLRQSQAEVSSVYPENRRSSFEFLGIGVIGLLLAGIPIWLTSLTIDPELYTTTRLSLAFMTGACFFGVGLVSLLLRSWFKTLFFSVLISFCVVFQFLIGFGFAREWMNQENFLWQLSARMPAILSGTRLIGQEVDLKYNFENSNAALINWMYSSADGKPDLRYYIFQDAARIESAIQRVETGPVREEHMLGVFYLQYRIAIEYQPASCLRVLDPDLDVHNPNLSVMMREAAAVTDFKAIQLAPEGSILARPPLELFGKSSPPDNWCIDFEKASLAAQFGDWKQVTDIAEKAFSRSNTTRNAMELVVYIEGYARQGNWQRSAELVNLALRLDPHLSTFCYLKQRLPPSPEREQVFAPLACVLK